MMPLLWWYGCAPAPRLYHNTRKLRKLSKHKMWDNFLVKSPYIWGGDTKEKEN